MLRHAPHLGRYHLARHASPRARHRLADPTVEHSLTCPRCGAQAGLENAFCGHCGSKLADSTSRAAGGPPCLRSDNRRPGPLLPVLGVIGVIAVLAGLWNYAMGPASQEPGTFSPTGAMVVARASAGTVLADGRVLFAGGAGDPGAGPATPSPKPSSSVGLPFGVLSSAELYDPHSGAFSATGPLITGRIARATLLADGRALIAGGQSPSGPLQTAELYDPQTGRFVPTGSMLSARRYAAAVRLLDGRVLICGGQGRDGPLASAELFDPRTGEFSRTGPMTVARPELDAIRLLDGRVLIVGGRTTTAPASAEIYDPATGAFSRTGSLAVTRFSFAASALSDGRVLLVGGWNGKEGRLASAEIFDPATGTFSLTGPTGAGTSINVATATLLHDGRVLVTYHDAGYAELYDPETGAFRPTGPMNARRHSVTATLLSDGRVLVAGGQDMLGNWLTSAELYQP